MTLYLSDDSDESDSDSEESDNNPAEGLEQDSAKPPMDPARNPISLPSPVSESEPRKSDVLSNEEKHVPKVTEVQSSELSPITSYLLDTPSSSAETH